MAENRMQRTQLQRIECDYRVKRYEDGTYRWRYDLNMLKNPTVLIDVYKVMGISLAIVGCFMFIIQSCDNGINLEDLGFVLKLMGILAGIMLVISLLGYLLYAALSGWKYIAYFIMDEKGVVHEQSTKAQEVGKTIGLLSVLVGLLAKKPGVAGSGMVAAGRTTMRSNFSNVRKVKAVRRMNTIMVNERFSKNRVYVCDEDFDFVYDFISSRCRLE